jgi:hypothetical protein
MNRRISKQQGDADFAQQLFNILMREKNIDMYMLILEQIYGIRKGEA